MFEYRVRLNLATTALIVTLGIAVSVITSTVVAARAYRSRGEQVNRQEQTIVVKGSTRKRIRSDRAVWQIRVEGENKQMQEAYKAVDASVQRVKAFLEQHGFSAAETGLGAIETTVHHVRTEKGQETREVASYTLSRTFFISTRDVDRVAQTAGQVTQLIQEGILVVSQAPEYYYSDSSALKLELMAAASKDARARAEEIARAAGCRLAGVRAATMGVIQITQPFSTEVSAEGIYDTSTIDKDAQAVVTITFQIEPT
ncbi:MAG: SIMPL domain-containing protein [Phycisphaerae bacterium]